MGRTDHLVPEAEPGFDHRPTMTAKDGKRLITSGAVYCSTCGRVLALNPDLKWTHLPLPAYRSRVVDSAEAVAWDAGWEAGNEYAISEPFDDRASKSKNPFRQTP